ncbi:DUF1236 domain-containing protein [Methylobacterium sp. J-067]|jgi:hypothetical protein|uniref:DUF1236 domain-containing protein n=1 Tax=Methylobacterium sp. J-067 TaxID=2836648 RepID=UPI001FBABD30|nr:DUF1236 domain-containing protein [Methylobacterium sp. J-067]MCJ2022713.1 DUF1236 domain-containing protein [Methylobacterium sp. J-067]
MTRNVWLTVAVVTLAWAGSVQAQGLERGAQEGADRGGMIAGPLGAVVGGAVGAAVGTANGILGIDRRARFRVYALGERRPSFAYAGPVRVGTVLPDDGVVYYDVPTEFALPNYNYTVVNDHPVLVDPRTRRVVEVID